MTDDDQDEWLDYASAGYGGAIDPWEDLVSVEETDESEEDIDDEDDFEDDTPSLRDMEAPPCPAPMGIRHVIRLGTCDHCLSRIGGRLNEGGLSAKEHGARIRADAIERDPMLSEISIDCRIEGIGHLLDFSHKKSFIYGHYVLISHKKVHLVIGRVSS